MATRRIALLHYRTAKAGFSLMELALVMVIVGLIIAAVFQGRSMVERSELASIAGDAKSVAEAVAQFQKVYKAMPGDMMNASTLLPGINADNPANPEWGNGNGNGKIEAETTNREDLKFWQHLRASGFLKKNFEERRISAMEPVMAASRVNNGMIVNEDDNIGVFFALSGVKPEGAPDITVIELSTVYSPTSFVAVKAYPSLSAKEAKDIDTRFDDGNPATGTIRAQPGLVYASGAWALSTCDYAAVSNEAACALLYTTENKSTQVEQSETVACGRVGDVRASASRSCEQNADGTRTGLVGMYVETCNKSGNWELTGHTCRTVECAGGAYGQSRVVACPANYGSGQVTQSCGESGEWFTQASTCNPALGDSCTTAGDRRTKACPANQTGGVYETCNGTSWQVTSNSCANVTCPGGQAVGSHRTGTCPAGFTGNTSETCAANGTWIATFLNNCKPNAVACTTVGAQREINCPAGSVGPNNSPKGITQECRTVSGSPQWVMISNRCQVTACGDYTVGQSRIAPKPCPANRPGNVIEVCTINAGQTSGAWVESLVNCAIDQCAVEVGPGNASWAAAGPGTNPTAGACMPGYSPNGTLPTRACSVSGVWGAVTNPCILSTPTVTLTSQNIPYHTFTTGGVPMKLDDDIVITNFTGSSAVTVSFSSTYDSDNDFLHFVNNNATTYGDITASYNAGLGRLTLSSPGGSATNAQWQNALRQVSFRNREMPFACSYRTVTFAVTNAGGSASGTMNLFLLPSEFNAAAYGTVLAWMDAESGTNTVVPGAQISTWTGRNGYVMNGSGASRPIYTTSALNGRSVVTFYRSHNLDGATNLGLSGNAAVSDFYVTRSAAVGGDCTTAGGAGCRYPCLYGFYSGATCPNNATQSCTWMPHIYSLGTNYLNTWGPINGITYPFAGTSGEYKLHSTVKAPGNMSTTSAKVNGSAITGMMPASDQAPNFGNAPLALGQCYIGWPNAKYEGELAELLIYNTAISAANRDVIERYLAGKWWRDAFYNTPLAPINTPANAGMMAVISSPTRVVLYQAPTNYVGTLCNPYASGWQGATSFSSCKEARAAGNTTSGTYSIDFDGAGGNPALNVYCDMTTSGGGWTLVWRGVGNQNPNSLATTAAFNSINAANGQTFKLTDASINSLLTEGYMIRASGTYNFTYYMKPTCAWAAMTRNNRAPNPECGTSYTSMTWTGAYGANPSHTEWYGIGDFPGNYGRFLTHHSGANSWLVGNGSNGVYCNGSAANCSLQVYVR
jgi:hypothetical protein